MNAGPVTVTFIQASSPPLSLNGVLRLLRQFRVGVLRSARSPEARLVSAS